VARGRDRLARATALLIAALILTACGARFTLPPATSGAGARTSTSGTGTTASTSTSDGGTNGTGSGTTPGATATTGSGPSHTTAPASGSTQAAITKAYESYLYDLSGLDDTLSHTYVGPLASVTTNRLAQASVRQAAAILAAQEHGVGTLRDDHLAITMTGTASAALADCQDQQDFYLISDDSGTPDPFVARGYFVGSAQLVLQNGHWLVDTFTTTHVRCSF
jgi:hypothetical protein